MTSIDLMDGVMKMPKINSAIIDQIAQLEVDALLDGLTDPELRRNPAFLDKVRRFLKENLGMEEGIWRNNHKPVKKDWFIM